MLKKPTKFLFATFLVVSVSGCSLISPRTANSPDSVNQKILGYSQLIQKDVLKFCEILPTITAVVGFVGIVVPPAQPIAASTVAARSICDAYDEANRPNPEDGLAKFTVDGKIIEAYTNF